jgi:predicted CXXCH cytochrome family protein
MPMRGTRLVAIASAIFVLSVCAVAAWAPHAMAQAAPAAPAVARQAAAPAGAQSPPPDYVGSAACRACHTAVYDRWSKTRMANVVRDPREHPDAIIPDLSKPDPLVTFTRNDIAFVYGSKWKQRYFTKIGNDYYPFPAQWDVAARQWRTYMVQPNTDWWVEHYPADNMKRPTGPLCDGCHSVNYNVQTKAVTEWNVGCEKCHGPGGNHVRAPGRATIINPARLDSARSVDLCVQCHSQGQPRTNPINGQYYDWAVGFRPGLDLKDFWDLEEHKLGTNTFTHFGDGSAHKNRMQGNDFVQSAMYTHGVTCASCHDPHGTENNADLIKPAKQVCLTCHNSNSANGPRGATLEAHTHHAASSPGSDCVACHMPRTATQIAGVNVRSHTFKFVTPRLTDDFQIPNPCLACHSGQNTQWVRQALRSWSGSPWRVE